MDRSDSALTWTVGEARKWAMLQLGRVPAEVPNLAAELLLGKVLRWTRVRVLAHPEAVLAPEQWENFRELVRRRLGNEPLQYLTGEQEFYGVSFAVTRDVLIPRPETEILVEEALLYARSNRRELRIADVGTGSGCIAIRFLMESPDALGWAIELSHSALAVARHNAQRYGVGDRLQFVQGDLLQCTAAKPLFDLILSNPPYVALRERAALPAVVLQEPETALFAGDSGLELFPRLIPEAAARLVPGGYLLLEIGYGQDASVRALIRAAGLKLERIVEDLQGIPRCVIAQRSP